MFLYSVGCRQALPEGKGQNSCRGLYTRCAEFHEPCALTRSVATRRKEGRARSLHLFYPERAQIVARAALTVSVGVKLKRRSCDGGD